MDIKHFTENERLKALRGYNLLDTLPEKDFDDITLLASTICQTPISLVTLIDQNRQWFKSVHGLDVSETPREYSFCTIGIQTPYQPFIVKDARNDSRFDDNPLVHGEPFVIFYAGIPLVTPEGFPLGSLCIVDHQPRELSEHQLVSLKALANQVATKFELRKKIIELKLAQEDLRNFTKMLSQDFNDPLRIMHSYAGLIKRSFVDKVGEEDAKMLEFISSSSSKLITLVNGIRDFSHAIDLVETKELFNLKDLIEETINLLNVPAGLNFEYTDNLPEIFNSKAGLQQILLNLLSNATKYNDKEKGHVQISSTQDEHYYKFIISDNGPGVSNEFYNKIFQPLQTLGEKDRFGKIGNGIGLAVVKRIVEKLNGQIKVKSELGKGTTFEFWIAI